MIKRFTKEIVKRILDQNNGFKWKTSYEGNNFRQYCNYTIEDGDMYVSSSGKGNWSDSRFSYEKTPVDLETARRIIKKAIDYLNISGIEE